MGKIDKDQSSHEDWRDWVRNSDAGKLKPQEADKLVEDKEKEHDEG